MSIFQVTTIFFAFFDSNLSMVQGDVSFHYSLVNLKTGSTSVKAPGGKFPLGRFLMMSTREEETTFNIHIPQKGTYLLEIGRRANTTF
jgi:hypothetical protein